MHILHKWKNDSKNARTCGKCGKHQYHIETGWQKVNCRVYKQMVLYDLSKDMKTIEDLKHNCDYCSVEHNDGEVK